MKNIKYLIYLLKHKFLVFIFCCRLGIPLLGITHDLSKFSKSEWRGYADYLFGGSDNINDAVIHHLTHNPHHWQYWETDVVLDNGKRYCHHMDNKYILEMIKNTLLRVPNTIKGAVKNNAIVL